MTRVKLTDDQVRAIRSEYAATRLSAAAIATKYGVGRHAIARLVGGRTHAKVQGGGSAADEVVERVARAIAQAHYEEDSREADNVTFLVENNWQYWKPEAVAAIAAYEAKGDIPTLR